MENITLGMIFGAIVLVVGLIKGLKYITRSIKEFLESLLKDAFDDINEKLTGLQEKVMIVDMDSCKNFLVSKLSEIDKGHSLYDIEMERFWEMYKHYTDLGGNSYIQRKVEQLKADGNL